MSKPKRKEKEKKIEKTRKQKRKDGENKSTGNKPRMGAFELVSQLEIKKENFAHTNTLRSQLSYP